jgi:hypothetical protein
LFNETIANLWNTHPKKVYGIKMAYKSTEDLPNEDDDPNIPINPPNDDPDIPIDIPNVEISVSSGVEYVEVDKY